ncbi:retrotransposon protein, putative, ty1-copia subclass [Tanacetum coccineum]
MVEDVENEKSNVSDSDEPILLNTHLTDKVESFAPEDDIDEINAFLAMEVSSNFEEGYFDSEGDVTFLRIYLVMIPPIISLPKSDPLHHEFVGDLITLPSRITREHEDYLSRMTLLYEISTSRSQENVHANLSSIIESLPISLIPVEDSDPVQEEIDIFLVPDDLILPGVENDDSEDEDNELPNLDHQDNPSSPRPPPEPPDVSQQQALAAPQPEYLIVHWSSYGLDISVYVTVESSESDMLKTEKSKVTYIIPYSLGIAPVAIIDRQLPFQYTITSRSTDVVVMALPAQNINHSTFRSMFEREKLSGNNFNDWFRQLKLVLRVEKKMYVIEQPLPAAPAADSQAQVLSQWNAVYDAYNEVACLILGKEGKPVATYVLQMKGYVDQLECLGYMLPQDLIVGLILNGLTKDFAGFVRNYNMHNMGKTIGELHAMLIEYEKGLPKKAETPQVMMIKGGKIQKANKKSLKAKGKGKANGKGKDKQVYIPKPKNPKPSTKEHPAKDDTCRHCKEVGHWKRNCPVYLAELLKKKKQVGSASSSGIFTIELFAFPNKSWVYDTGCGTHICITKQGFREARKLKQGALYLYVGNGVRAQVEAIGSYDLVLPNGLVICLDNCHYAPSITRGVVLVHHLVENGFVQCFTDFGISVSKNNVFYFNAIPSNGIYEIDMHDLVPNVNSIYNVSTKRAKHNLDSTYLWHCRLAHISKKRIEKLQQEGLLKSTDDESFDQCVSCLSGKMTRKSFPHHDYSRYGYVYLLKHKHEVFETFKVFKNEVENQLGKTVKALRSDRGGEYINQEFKDYLKACGIVQQLTPPYTPQHNGVWGCEALVKQDTPDKLQQRSVKCIFIGYPKETMGYYFYIPPKNKIVVARYAEFFEKKFITQEVSGRAMDLEEIQDEDTSPSEITSEIPMEVEGFEPPQEEVILVRRSERTHRAPDHLCLNVEAEEHSLGDLNEPTSYKAAMLDSESNKWIDAMNAEIQSMMDNMVWVLVDLPPGCKTVGSKWIFKKKTDMDGIVHTYKARLVAKGYTQLYGVDYEETFSPVADIRAIRILISIAAFYDYEIWQMDVKTSFLNGYLDEDIYMVEPEGFVDPNHPIKVCKLQRSIYGLKQASRSWNKRFDEKIKRFGFDQILMSHVYIKRLVGVMLHSLSWEATFILGIKIYRDRSKRLIGLGENAYMDKILKRYKMDNSKRGHIPMQERLDLNKTQGAVDWKSSKQSTTAMSATEAEYIAASEAAMEAVWIRKFISGLGIVPTINEPIRMFCDNSAALHFANEPGVQRGARHYHRRYHYVRESIALGEIRFLKVHTDDNLADPFTKALSKGKLTQHARSMGLRLASSFM